MARAWSCATSRAADLRLSVIDDGGGGQESRDETAECDQDQPGAVLVLDLSTVTPPPGFDVCRTQPLPRLRPRIFAARRPSPDPSRAAGIGAPARRTPGRGRAARRTPPSPRHLPFPWDQSYVGPLA